MDYISIGLGFFFIAIGVSRSNFFLKKFDSTIGRNFAALLNILVGLAFFGIAFFPS